MTHEPAIEQTPHGLTIQVPSGTQTSHCIQMPDVEPGGRWNAVIGKDARAVLCEQDIRSSEIIVEEGAQLELMCLQMQEHPTNNECIKTIIVHERAVVRLFVGAFHSVNLTVNGSLAGRKAALGQHLLYFAGGRERIATIFNTTHLAEDTFSRVLARGVATDRAHVQVTGDVSVGQSAAHADTHVQHDGIILSCTAGISVLPRLNIRTDDVKASHGSAVRFIEPEQLFYMQTRGVDEKRAIETILAGFLDESLAIVREPDIVRQVRTMLESKQLMSHE